MTSFLTRVLLALQKSSVMVTFFMSNGVMVMGGFSVLINVCLKWCDYIVIHFCIQ